MLGTERMKVKVCFVCLKTIKISAFKRNADGKEVDDLYFKFWRFAGGYLGIESGIDKESSWMKECFCDECKNVVSSLCQLYLELLQVQLRLSSKLGELLRLLESSESGISHKLGRVLIKSLAEQLGFAKRADVDKLRSLLKEKCKVKSQERLPEILIHRVELPTSFSYPNIAKNIKLEITSDDFLDEVDHDNGHASPFSAEMVEDEDIHSFSSEKNSNQGDGAPPKRSIDAASGARGVESESEDEIPEIKIEPVEADEQGMDDDDEPIYEIKRKEESDSDSTFEPDASPEHSSHESDSKSDWEPEEKSKKVKRSSTSMKSTSKKQSPRAHHEPTKEENRQQIDFVCQHCGKVLQSNQRLRHHIYQVHRGHPFQCSECSKQFKTKSGFKDHATRFGHSQSYLKTEKLHKTVLPRFTSTSISSNVHGKEDFICSTCSKGFATQQKLFHHTYKVHNERRPCSLCDKNFKTKQGLHDHLIVVHSIDPHPCPDCQETFKTQALLRYHMKYMHLNALQTPPKSPPPPPPEPRGRKRDSERWYRCPTCPRSYTKKELFDRHLQTCGKSEEGPKSNTEDQHRLEQCPTPNCPRSYYNNGALQRHLLTCEQTEENVEQNFANIESKDETHICEQCGKVFQNATHMKKHVYYSHLRGEEKRKKYSCPNCVIVYQNQKKLDRHLRQCSKEKPFYKGRTALDPGRTQLRVIRYDDKPDAEGKFPCPHCPKVYLNAIQRGRHLHYTHPAVPFICSHCGVTRSTNVALQRHITAFHKPKDRLCPHCGKTLATSYMAVHIRLVHPQYAPKRIRYSCPNCSEGFYAKSQLAKHSLECPGRRTDAVGDLKTE